MLIMVIAGNGQRHVLPVGAWSERDRQAIRLAYEASGYDVMTRTAR